LQADGIDKGMHGFGKVVEAVNVLAAGWGSRKAETGKIRGNDVVALRRWRTGRRGSEVRRATSFARAIRRLL